MVCTDCIFPVILYVLSSILLVVLIVLVVKAISTLKKVDTIIDDINIKSGKLNGLFDIVDNTTDTLSLISDKVVGAVVNGVSSLLSRKKKKENEENE